MTKQQAEKPSGALDESSRSTIASSTYRRLRDDVLEIVLQPAEKLRFSDLAERYEVSVGSLREALTELRAEGFIISEAGKGFSVRPAFTEDLLDITNLRITLESIALEDSIANGGDEWEARIVSALHLLGKVETDSIRAARSPEDGWEDRHRRFHDALLAACRSPWTLRFCSILADHGHRYRKLMRKEWPGTRNPHEEHRAIAAAVLARDLGAATQLLSAHYRATTDEIVQTLAGG